MLYFRDRNRLLKLQYPAEAFASQLMRRNSDVHTSLGRIHVDEWVLDA